MQRLPGSAFRVRRGPRGAQRIPEYPGGQPYNRCLGRREGQQLQGHELLLRQPDRQSAECRPLLRRPPAARGCGLGTSSGRSDNPSGPIKKAGRSESRRGRVTPFFCVIGLPWRRSGFQCVHDLDRQPAPSPVPGRTPVVQHSRDHRADRDSRVRVCPQRGNRFQSAVHSLAAWPARFLR